MTKIYFFKVWKEKKTKREENKIYKKKNQSKPFQKNFFSQTTSPPLLTHILKNLSSFQLPNTTWSKNLTQVEKKRVKNMFRACWKQASRRLKTCWKHASRRLENSPIHYFLFLDSFFFNITSLLTLALCRCRLKANKFHDYYRSFLKFVVTKNQLGVVESVLWNRIILQGRKNINKKKYYGEKSSKK